MDEQLENRLRFLRKANTDGMPHSDLGLFDHVLGTRQLLVEWKALARAVYPPEEVANWPGNAIQWSAARSVAANQPQQPWSDV